MCEKKRQVETAG